MVGALSATFFSVLIGGCAVSPAVPESQLKKIESVASSHSAHAYIIDTKPGTGRPVTFYLVRNESTWDVSFSGNSVADERVEKFLYWPSERRVNFDFSKGGLKSISDTVLCNDKSSQTRVSASDYSPCNSNFRVQESLLVPRLLAGVFTAGLSELNPRVRSSEAFKMDVDLLQNVLVSQQIDIKTKPLEYRNNYESISSKAGLVEFMRRYAGYDPDGLVVSARERLAVIEENENILAKAKKAAGSRESYIERSTPKRAEKYCKEYASSKELFGLCREMLMTRVTELARKRADKIYRSNICKNVASQLSGVISKGLCAQYVESGSCVSASVSNNRICAILKLGS